MSQLDTKRYCSGKLNLFFLLGDVGSYVRNYGPKKSGVHSSEVCFLVLPLRIHCFGKGLTFRLQVLQVLPQAKPFGRFSKKLCREQGHSVKPATKAVYEGCSKNNVTCIGAHIAEVLLFILICSALQNTLRQPEHTFLAGQSIFGSIFHTLQWGHPSDTDKQQIQGHFSNCISFQINDI